ncbi:MAG: hypothetical protein HQL08_15720 [Nitrospirae bacterium]|nr:hypothetical protein [Nitrospirota bacterium]
MDLVKDRLIYISAAEFSHLVQTAYPDRIFQERIRIVAEEKNIPAFRVGKVIREPRFKELGIKSLYLGLSDGARTNEIRRAGGGDIGNEQIWQAYELGKEKAIDMIQELKKTLKEADFSKSKPLFNMIWLLDDFSGSGYTYIRFDSAEKKFKGKIKKIYERLDLGDLIDTSHYEVFLLLYVATRQAVDHIEYWAEQFTSQNGYKPLQLRVLCLIEPETALTRETVPQLEEIILHRDYYDDKATDKHILVGGTPDARWGFAGCALPVVLSHNTPNNPVYLLWGPESYSFHGLFPRISRHREF